VLLDVRTNVRNAVRMAVRTNLMLPEDLVAEVDRVAGPRNRSRYVAEAVAARLRRDRLKETWDRSFGILAAEDYLHWATSEMVVEWVRALRAEETDPGPDPIPVVGTVPDDRPPLRMYRRRGAEAASDHGPAGRDPGGEAADADPR
jgi:hypothetical protein